MREYTAEQIQELKSNSYTLNVTTHKLYFTKEFKEDFWVSYQAGNAPRKILKDFGYDISLFGQKQIDSIVQRVKAQALSGEGFREGENRERRTPIKEPVHIQDEPDYPDAFKQMQHEVLYLRQEMEFLKKIIKADNAKRRD